MEFDLKLIQAYFKYFVVLYISITIWIGLNYLDDETKRNQEIVQQALVIYKMEVEKGIKSDQLPKILSTLNMEITQK